MHERTRADASTHVRTITRAPTPTKHAHTQTEALTTTKSAMEDFLGDEKRLNNTRAWIAKDVGSAEQRVVLKCFEKTFSCYIIPTHGKPMREQATALEVGPVQLLPQPLT